MPPDDQAMPTLRDLIQRHTDRTGESRRALGERSGVRHQTLGTWFSGEIKEFPDPPTIRAFAHATSYSLETVILAAARTIGLQIAGVSELAAMLPAAARNLTKRQQDAIIAVVAAMLEPAEFDLSRVEGLRLAEGATREESNNHTGH